VHATLYVFRRQVLRYNVLMGQLSIPDARSAPQLLTLDDFRAAVQKDADLDPASVLVLRDFEGDDVQVKARHEVAGQVYDWTCSSGAVDRDKDILSPAGWDLRAYKTSPVWLAFHDSTLGPIGVSTSIGVEDEKLQSTMKFGPVPLAQSLKQMLDWRLEQKALGDRGGSCSVGFMPTKWAWAPEESKRGMGIDFAKQELLEISLVPIGSNRDAMLRMKAAGVECGPVADWAERYRRSESGTIAVDLATAEAIVRTLAPSTGLKLFQMGADAVTKLSPAKAPEGTQTHDPAEEDPLAAAIGELVETLKAPRPLLPEIKVEASMPPAKETPPDPALVEAYAAECAHKLAESAFIARTGRPFTAAGDP